MTIKDLIKELLEFNSGMHIAFDAVNLTDINGVNGGHPNITSIEISDGLGGEYVLLKSDET